MPDTMVLAEEYGDWEESESLRRIDLLCLGRDAQIIVVELKRTDSGGHSDLQAIRYAAMVSKMTFSQAIKALTEERNISEKEAEKKILKFLEWRDPQDSFAKEVKIVLVSADFTKEITTTALWLREYDLDVSCIRICPYVHEGKVLMDIETIVPLPEAEDYQVRIQNKEQEERQIRVQNRDFTRYDLTVDGHTFTNLPKRELILRVAQKAHKDGHKPYEIFEETASWIAVNGNLDSAAFIKIPKSERVEGSSITNIERFYTEDDQLFHEEHRTYAFTKMWGSTTVKYVEDMIDRLGLKGVTYAPSPKNELD